MNVCNPPTLLATSLFQLRNLCLRNFRWPREWHCLGHPPFRRPGQAFRRSHKQPRSSKLCKLKWQNMCYNSHLKKILISTYIDCEMLFLTEFWSHPYLVRCHFDIHAPTELGSSKVQQRRTWFDWTKAVNWRPKLLHMIGPYLDKAKFGCKICITFHESGIWYLNLTPPSHICFLNREGTLIKTQERI